MYFSVIVFYRYRATWPKSSGNRGMGFRRGNFDNAFGLDLDLQLELDLGPRIWDLGSGHTFGLHDKTFVANFLCTVVASKWQFNNGHYFLAKRYELNIFSTCIVVSNNLK